MGDCDKEAACIDGNGVGRFASLRRYKLKALLVLGDAVAIMLSYVLTGWRSGYWTRQGTVRLTFIVVFCVVAGLWALRSQGLYLSRVSAVRVVEFTRTARAVALLAVLVLLADRVSHYDWLVRQTIIASVGCFVLLCIVRSIFRAWLASARQQGRYCRRIVIIGTDDEAVRLINLFQTHRDLGLTVVGIVGDKDEAFRRGLGDMWLGEADRPEILVDIADLSGVVTSTSGMSSTRLNGLIRDLHHSGLHIHLATGISGIAVRRLRSVPLAHEPLLYVEAPSLAKGELFVKRCFDVVVASLGLIVMSPVLLAVAIAIKLDDGAPILFSQSRVGRGGRTFGVLKFRSMTVDAENKLDELGGGNERQGPLFKMENDPRVTRVGRFLRDSSLDELPQLWNVLRGQMSLVGPRPALPAEVINFSSELRTREQVMPGITGLWQVEARDNPSFEAYRRLDLFYVDNWSLTLDLMILVGTLEQVLVRLFRALRTSRASSIQPVDGAEAVLAEDLTSAVVAGGQ
jgi:exopolysaccharide biosynthesis polyprenyl glycosylphosphotransferase